MKRATKNASSQRKKQEKLDERVNYLRAKGRLVTLETLRKISFIKPEDRRSTIRDTLKITSIKQSYIYKSLQNLEEEIDCAQKIMKNFLISENCSNVKSFLESRTGVIGTQIDEVDSKLERVTRSIETEEVKNGPIDVEDKLLYKFQLNEEEISAVHGSLAEINKQCSSEPLPNITLASDFDIKASKADNHLSLEDFHPFFFDTRLISCFTAVDA